MLTILILQGNVSIVLYWGDPGELLGVALCITIEDKLPRSFKLRLVRSRASICLCRKQIALLGSSCIARRPSEGNKSTLNLRFMQGVLPDFDDWQFLFFLASPLNQLILRLIH